MRRFATFSFTIVLATLVLIGRPAGAQVKRHQATGSVATSVPTQIVLLKTFGRNQARWNFVVNPKTKLEGKLTKGERVRIYYHNDDKGQRVAEEVKILAPATPVVSKPAPAVSSAPPPSAPSPQSH